LGHSVNSRSLDMIITPQLLASRHGRHRARGRANDIVELPGVSGLPLSSTRTRRPA
jgi:hypothetical protein